MFVVTRTYRGTGAKELFDLLELRKAEVEGVIREISGLVGYTMFRTGDGGVSITVCEDQAGIDESVQVARDWIVKNGGGLEVDPPSVAAGEAFVKIG